MSIPRLLLLLPALLCSCQKQVHTWTLHQALDYLDYPQTMSRGVDYLGSDADFHYFEHKLEMASDKRNSFGYVSDNLNASDRDKARVMKDYPVVAKMPVLVFDTTASEAEISACEEIILKYCPEYTYEELEWDHALTDYESEDENPPVFRLALEYKIEDGALSVRLPANGIRFNESLYTLESIDVLPYMGADCRGYGL